MGLKFDKSVATVEGFKEVLNFSNAKTVVDCMFDTNTADNIGFSAVEDVDEIRSACSGPVLSLFEVLEKYYTENDDCKMLRKNTIWRLMKDEGFNYSKDNVVSLLFLQKIANCAVKQKDMAHQNIEYSFAFDFSKLEDSELRIDKIA